MNSDIGTLDDGHLLKKRHVIQLLYEYISTKKVTHCTQYLSTKNVFVGKGGGTKLLT